MPRKLTRDAGGAVLGGVAAGFGRYLDVDPVLVRLAFVLLAFVNGLGLLVYLAGWALMPVGVAAHAGAAPAADAASSTAAFESLRDASDRITAEVKKASGDAASAQLVIGALLVVIGGLLLLHNLGWLHWPHWMRFETLWPLLLIALGLGLVFKSKNAASA